MLALRSSMKRLGRKTAWQLAETTRRLREVRAVEKHAAEMLARVNEWTSIEGAESKLRPEDFE
jgi:hypothetical protein